MVSDKMNFIKASNAYVSFIRSYNEYDYKEIFNVDKLNYLDLS